jgi:cellobiose phosphorylase
VKTPSAEFNTMINTWNAYNCFMTFIWSRAASFIYCGLRNGYGYRDTVQDIQGVIHLAPEMAKEKIRFMLSAQVDNGAGLPLVKFTHNAGHEDTPDDASYVQETGHPAYRADDALWLFPTVFKYVSESGDLAFIDEIIPFANKDEGTVYEHLKRAIGFSLDHLGPHGMPAGLHADWNDCLRLGAAGESTFVAFQFYLALRIMKQFAEHKNDGEYIEWLNGAQEKTRRILKSLCWDEDRFIRGFTEAGDVIGAKHAPEANMWLNPQSWSVISGLADDAQADTALSSVFERLNTKFGAILMDPPYREHAFDGALAVIYNAGVKENAGIFSQSQGWIILAEALRGHGERAFNYFLENAPAAQNDCAEIRKLEPYCYGQFTEGKASPHFGRSHVHWLTGTASTVMVGCVEGILGMRPDFYGLRIAPSVPAKWESFEIEKDFRGCRLHIRVRNEGHAESGCVKLLVNGKEMEGNYIPAECLTKETEVELYMS